VEPVARVPAAGKRGDAISPAIALLPFSLAVARILGAWYPFVFRVG
jgi:hypothetical protein